MKTKEAELRAEVSVDEFASAIFASLGFEGRLPAGLVKSYNEFKRMKDKMSPGRLSAEGFATVVTLYRLSI